MIVKHENMKRILSHIEDIPVYMFTRLELTPDNPLYYTRYGYAALLGITLFGGLLLNGNNPIS